jgi:hypothetical protein
MYCEFASGSSAGLARWHLLPLLRSGAAKQNVVLEQHQGSWPLLVPPAPSLYHAYYHALTAIDL